MFRATYLSSQHMVQQTVPLTHKDELSDALAILVRSAKALTL